MTISEDGAINIPKIKISCISPHKKSTCYERVSNNLKRTSITKERKHDVYIKKGESTKPKAEGTQICAVKTFIFSKF